MPNGEKVRRTWMCYSPTRKSLFCFCCRLFPTLTHSEPAFVSEEGFKNWRKLSPRVIDHESSPSHQQSLLKWKELELRHRTGYTLDCTTQVQIQKEQEKWREILKRILDIISFLGKQNLALRGHREGNPFESTQNKGNFLELVKLLSKYDPVLKEHTLRIQLGGAAQPSYLSPKVQNEFINLLGEQVRRRIIQRVKEAKYFL
ncbi:hypothetical protein RI129_002712 [Pyrocoelia pectoralis]|uniref:DUF4371 domain-containing protein n=1 Tax=Pyrocoelia pectoralis TaxID=417401 RepID=A0AAN7VGJ6_9COLE